MTQAPTERSSLRRRLEQERGRVWVVGHRGAMGYCPENTLASFERGLELGADWIEMDVHLSRDGALMSFMTKRSIARPMATATSKTTRSPNCGASMRATANAS